MAPSEPEIWRQMVATKPALGVVLEWGRAGSNPENDDTILAPETVRNGKEAWSRRDEETVRNGSESPPGEKAWGGTLRPSSTTATLGRSY